MDAPNAPNPANLNAQDQFVDVVQGPTNHVQGPTIQNQAEGPIVQNQAQGLRVPQIKIRLKFLQFRTKLKVLQLKFPVQGPAQIGQNVPCPATTTSGPSTTGPC